MSVAELPVPYDDGGGPPSDRTPPQDVAAEQSVLGAMMLSKDAIADVVEVLREEGAEGGYGEPRDAAIELPVRHRADAIGPGWGPSPTKLPVARGCDPQRVVQLAKSRDGPVEIATHAVHRSVSPNPPATSFPAHPRDSVCPRQRRHH